MVCVIFLPLFENPPDRKACCHYLVHMKPTHCFSIGLMTVVACLLFSLFTPAAVQAAGVMNPTKPGVQTATAPAKTSTRKAERKRLRQAWQQAKAMMAASGRRLYRGDMPEKKRYNLSMLACIFGGASILTLFLFPPLGWALGISGLVMGIIALGQYRDSPRTTNDGKTLAVLGVVLGGCTILFTLIAVFVALALWGA